MSVLLVLLGLTLLLFIRGKWPPDVAALMAMFCLYFCGILDMGETLRGFSNPAVILVAALHVIGDSLSGKGWTALTTLLRVPLFRPYT